MSESPPSSLRPPVESGGSSKYVAVVALLAVGLVGLVVWKHFSADAPVVVVPPPAPAPSFPTNPREDDVPPPPPIEDSGPDTGPPKSTVASTSAAVCDAKTCSGSMTSDLESALAFRAKTAHKCYDDALAQDSTLHGSVKISVRIASNGNICSANPSSNDLANPNVANCIANRFRQAGHFPAPSGGCLDVNIPISLMPAH
jgi:hypothetical protein